MLEWFIEEARDFASLRGPLFAFNTTLALVPLLVGYLTFRRDRRPTAAWWCGLGVFLLFLPNAAYVLTDAIHLVRDVRREDSELALFAVYLPGYAVFFLTGLTFYVLALRRLEENVRSVWPALPWWTVWAALQGCVAVGVYLGRVTRLHSWYVVTRPRMVADAVASITDPGSLFLIVFTAATIGAAALVWRPVVDAGAHVAHAAGRAIRGE
jgi:uncharacterized membrane protein